MPREIKVKSIRDRFPVRYAQPQLLRLLMIGLALLVIAYSLFFLTRFVDRDTPVFFKLLPLIIMFVGLDSVLRQTTSLNAITFYEDRLCLAFLLRKKIVISYKDIKRLDIYRKITYYIHLSYNDESGASKLFKTPASFPKILEIVFNIADLAPQVEMNELLSQTVKLLRTKMEKTNEEQI